MIAFVALNTGGAIMAEPDRDEERPAGARKGSVRERGPRDDAMDEEEKVLAGEPDANMPALLTHDVPGG